MSFRHHAALAGAAGAPPAAALAVALLGTAATDLGPWYQDLRKPSWQPPDWLFGPAWTLIYALAALPACWPGRPRATVAPAVRGSSPCSRSTRSRTCSGASCSSASSARTGRWPRSGCSGCRSLLLIVVVLRRFQAASWLLAPYLAWVTFAALLNLAIVRLNYPFHAPA